MAASAEGLAPTRTSSGGSAAIIGLPSPTFPDDQIVVLTFCDRYDHFVPPMGGGCSFQVERVVLKLHKGPGAPVPGCKVENCQKHLNMTATMTRTITKYVCLSKSYGLSMLWFVYVIVCLCYVLSMLWFSIEDQRATASQGKRNGTRN